MPVELVLSDRVSLSLGRCLEVDRRDEARWAGTLSSCDRRLRRRRRTRLCGLLFASLALTIPRQLTDAAWSAPQLARVSTTIQSLRAVSPDEAYDGIIREAAIVYSVDASLIRSIIQAESKFDPWAVSRVGAVGLMQLMPDVARAFGLEEPFDPRENIMAGARLLRELLDRHHGDVSLAIASYNAGPTAVDAYGGVPPFGETKAYVKKVTGLIADARRYNND